jgi:hypothetical protein
MRFRKRMAWAEKLPSGRYRGLYRDASGRKRSAGSFTHKARQAARPPRSRKQARRDAWRDADSFLRPWGQWCERWWESRDVEDSTMRGDTHRRSNHLEPRWATCRSGRSPATTSGMGRHLRKSGVGPETVKRIVHLFSASMNAAVDAEVVAANPAARLKLVRGRRRRSGT